MDLINLLLVVAVGVTLFFGFSIFFHRNEGEKFAVPFFLLAVTMAAWSVAEILMRSASATDALTFVRIDYAIAVFIPVFFFIFVFQFTDYQIFRRYKLAVQATIFLLGCFAFITTLTSSSIVKSVVTNLGTENVIYFGSHYPWYIVYYLVLFPAAYLLLFRSYTRAYSIDKKNQIVVVLIGTLVNSTFGLATDLIIPWLGDNSAGWVANFTSIFFMGSILYGMVRYQLFNFKVIATELLAVALWSILAVELFLTESTFIFFVRLTVFVSVVALSIFLIRSTYREVESREEIQRLYKELEVKNQKLTELDKLKSQFLSIATHELRTPLTIVRNFMSLLMDGTYGKMPPAATEGAQQVFERVTDMAHSVDTYLNVSRIEQGKISYTFEKGDITRLARLAVEGLKANADKKKLSLTLDVKPGAETLMANMDGPKITEVIINLIDNSIKYTPQGSVAVTLERIGQKARMTITDTGVGMTEKTRANLFKLFSPGEDSKRINPASTGVGLYVSKAHVEAHKGTLQALSEGAGKGSTFVFDIPLVS